ncbi:MAG: hypothetical protein GWN99_02415 [Gemmatimonadetes bacterium]|uniref:Haemolysin activator HlyB C-terminal domain-containing protein n=1 Tax=Candidatus Kutchimonas denitrificans TaxID=3056748 RepID=A0AAE5CBQ2_9BACT|nr:hypothetical protein [Gemmatimonadota bacterium]NIR74808.1 hypothetical protein [Candidatus Kutchimonas denitrificans]NIR99919.1 hypothetical protein [Gemmatimonadota bacterium]NIT65503.1 hypothetical protein [Gemmatimonadota bacterium]NIU52473.1 hypothetical protein [Gemmatimonadota bacterium]
MRSRRSDRKVGRPARPIVRAAFAAILLLVAAPGLAAQDVLELARHRHAEPDTTLQDYRARLNTLVSAGWVSDPLARPRLIIASELASRVAWRQAGGLQVRMLGQRYVTSFGRDVEAGLDFDEPWFVATVPGDSLRLLGGIELPNRAAVHPFAPGAARFYSYETGDTVALLVPGRRVDLIEIRVTPTRGDESLVVGSLWVDAATGDIGAMQIRFVGRPLWADDDDPDGQKWANRILSLSADVQQGLWEARYWLPHRQELELMVRIPFIGRFAVPIVFKNEFGAYDINTGQPIEWLSPDSLRVAAEPTDDYDEGATLSLRVGEEPRRVSGPDTVPGERHFPERDRLQVRAGPAERGWEIVRPPDDSLLAYDAWDRPLEEPASRLTLPSTEELERRARKLSNEIVGRKLFSIQYDRLPEFLRYNRIEALGLGLAGRYDLPRRPFWSLGAGVGFGVADLALKGRLDLRYDAPRTRLELVAFSELHLTGAPLTDDKRAYGKFLRALFLGRDDNDYYRASGAALIVGRRWGRFGARLGGGWEDHRSVDKNTDIAVPGIWQDTVFPPNPPADEGGFWRGDIAATYYIGDWTRPTDRTEFTVGLDVGTGEGFDYAQPRAGLEGRLDLGDVIAVAFDARAGWTAGTAPLQRLWGIGGLETVRGFTYGSLRGDSYWHAQLELSPRRKPITPVLFGDVGWAGETGDWPSSQVDPLWSAGIGVSYLWGVLRTDLVFPKFDDVWFEFYFAGAL